MLLAVIRSVKRSPEFCSPGGSEMKVARKHADDDVRTAVQRHRLPQRIPSSAEPLLPASVAQHDGVRGGWRILAVLEIASEHRSDAEGAKETRAHARASHLLRAFCRAQRESTVQGICIDRAENLVETLPVEKIKVRNRRLQTRSGRLEDGDQPGLIAIWQRLDQRGIHKSEDGHASATT